MTVTFSYLVFSYLFGVGYIATRWELKNYKIEVSDLIAALFVFPLSPIIFPIALGCAIAKNV